MGQFDDDFEKSIIFNLYAGFGANPENPSTHLDGSTNFVVQVEITKDDDYYYFNGSVFSNGYMICDTVHILIVNDITTAASTNAAPGQFPVQVSSISSISNIAYSRTG